MATSASVRVAVERRERVATLTLDRPPLNILDLETLASLDEVLAGLAADRELHLLVLRGAPPKAFSAGVAVEDHTPDKVGDMLALFHRGLRRLRDMPAITLAAVHGHCLGGGMELALACDLRLATDTARFGQPEVELGCYPPFAAALYPRLIGYARTLELLLSGRTMDAAEAESLGLVNQVVPADELDERLAAMVENLAGKSAPVARLIKRTVAAGRDLPFEAALTEAETLYLEDLCRTEDMAEGLNAFLEKRRPAWRHR